MTQRIKKRFRRRGRNNGEEPARGDPQDNGAFEYFRNGTIRGTVLDKAINDFCKKSGINLSTIEKYKIKINADRDLIKKRLGFSKVNGQDLCDVNRLIEIPYWNSEGRITQYAYKPITPVYDKEKNQRKYFNPKGKLAIPYILPEVWAVKDKVTKPLWITEGCKKALKLVQHGRYPISLSGVYNFKVAKNSKDKEHRYLSEEFESFNWNGRTVYMAFDGDFSSNRQVRYALFELEFKLFGENAIVKVATWSEGKGIDDYLATRKNPDRVLERIEHSAISLLDLIQPEYDKELVRAMVYVKLDAKRERQLHTAIADKLKITVKTLKSEIKKAKDRLGKPKEEIRFEPEEGESKWAFVKYIRKAKGLHGFERKQTISGFILNDMRLSGRFFNTNNHTYYWFDDRETTLYEIEVNNKFLQAHVRDEFNINATEGEYKHLAKELEGEAITNGELTEVQRYAFYDDKSKCLYISESDHRMYKLDGTNVTLINNGIDNVFFLPEWNLGGLKYKKNYEKYFDAIMINPINFEVGEGVSLNKGEQRHMIKLWIHTLFFESLQPTKVIMAIIGDKGSGKTSVQKGIGQMLFGKEFDVAQLTSSEGDFMATTSNSYFVAYDNVDTYSKWLNDNLACCGTGAQYSKREYYTTNTMSKYVQKCFLSLSSRTPNFRRADVADRLLLFRVDKRERFKGQKRLLTQIKRKRRSLMSEIMDNLNCIIEYLREDDEVYESTHRMADFAELIYKINIALDGEEGKVEELLTNMDMERNAFVLEGNQFYEFLCIWMEDNEGRIVEIRHLYDDFKKIAEEHKYEFKCNSTNSLTKQFRAVYNELLDKFDIDIDKGNKPWTYTFNHKPLDDEPETEGKTVFKKRHLEP